MAAKRSPTYMGDPTNKRSVTDGARHLHGFCHYWNPEDEPEAVLEQRMRHYGRYLAFRLGEYRRVVALRRITQMER